MADIKLKQGGREVTFTKVGDYFGVRLKGGTRADVRALETEGDRTASGVRHLGSTGPAGFELFALTAPERIEGATDELRARSGAEAVTHVYSTSSQSGAIVIPTGQLTIKFKADVSQKRQLELLQQYGLEILGDLAYMPGAMQVRVSGASPKNPLKTAAALQSASEVELAEPELGFRPERQSPDPLLSAQWHLKNDGGLTGLEEGADVNAEGAWAFTKGTRDITVCVIDDGFDLEHPDFAGEGKVVAPRDFGQDDSDPSPTGTDDRHGTACAGVAIAEENGVGVVGLAPRCSFMPIRMSGWLTDDAIIAMFQHAMDSGADVISCSWSAKNWDFPLSTRITAYLSHVATQGRGGKGCVILFAAGNEDRPLDGTKNGQRSVQGFALHPDVIAVAASNSLNQRSYYSNFGPALAICAPSSGSPGRGITTTDLLGGAGYSADDYTSTFGGTSSATPLAAGLAALVLSVNPDLTAAEVKQIMMDTAVKIDSRNAEYVDGHSAKLGHGRIDAGAAVKRAMGQGAALAQMLYLEHRVTRPIRDFKETRDEIDFAADVTIEELEVTLDVRHTYVGDLNVILTAPDGSETALHQRTGGGQDDLILTYRSGSSTGLFSQLIGKSAKGRWGLRVSDHAPEDEGALHKWGLGVRYHA